MLYVVPWKRADLGELSGKPARSLLDEVPRRWTVTCSSDRIAHHDALKPDPAATPLGEQLPLPS